MNCFICNKKLLVENYLGFSCICDKCLKVLKKSEVKQSLNIYDLNKQIKFLVESLESIRDDFGVYGEDAIDMKEEARDTLKEWKDGRVG